MRNKKRDHFFIKSLKEEIKKIEGFIENVDYNIFLKDIKTQYSIFKAFENMGEASKNISGDVKQKYPDIPWKDLAQLRDKLSHGYFGIDPERIWNELNEELPKLKKNLDQLKISESAG